MLSAINFKPADYCRSYNDIVLQIIKLVKFSSKMVSSLLIAKKYSLVAFNLAKKDNLIDVFSLGLKKIVNFLSPEIIKELSNPTISKLNLSKIVVEIAEKLSIDDKLIVFLKLLSSSRRINLTKEIENQFSTLVKMEKKILEVEVFSSVKISDENMLAIKTNLQKKYPSFTIETKLNIKKDILGGLIIKIGSKIIDVSLKKQFFILKKTLNSSE